MTFIDESVRARAFDRIATSDDGGCWLWIGETFSNGYGHLSVVRAGVRRRHLAHRLIWTLLRGEIADGLTIDHLCRNKACVNPDHLEPVSAAVNIQRAAGWIDGRCKRGHELTDDNIYVARLNGKRQCRACWTARGAERIAS